MNVSTKIFAIGCGTGNYGHNRQKLGQWLLALLAGCAAIILATCSSPAGQVEKGDTPAEVRASLGEPDERQEFVIPAGPFFGPQVRLSDLLAAGTVVEEWRYRRNGEILYVWFAATESRQPLEEWTVIETAVYPEGAVY